VEIRGGYDLTFTVADPVARPVVIDGQNVREAFAVDCPVASPDPCLLKLVGVTLTRGYSPTDLGTRNAFGGAIDAYLAHIELEDVGFTENVAQGQDAVSGLPGDGGGGALSLRSASASLKRCTFTGNGAYGGSGTGSASRGGLGAGGAIFAYESTIAMQDIVATDNTAQAGDAPAAYGTVGIQSADGMGGFLAMVYGSGSAQNLSIARNRAEGGVAATRGGLGLGGAFFLQLVSSLSLNRLHVFSNSAIGGTGGINLGGGGGIFAEDSVIELQDSQLVENRAEGVSGGSGEGGSAGGGGYYLNSAQPQASRLTATNVVIGKNRAIAGPGTPKGLALGGGLFIQCPGGPGTCSTAGGASSEAALVHATFADNAVSGATYNQGSALWVGTQASADSAFSIVSGHLTPLSSDDRGETVLSWGTTSMSDTLWHNNTLKAYAVIGIGTFTDVSPRVGSPDYVATTASPPDYHILASSAARDEALGSTTPGDLDGGLRVAGGMPDLGADEFGVPEPANPAAGVAALLSLIVLRRARRCSF
jgi:hypothetical protein